MDEHAARSEAFERFYARNYKRVFHVARKRLHGTSAAEDACAETFRITWGRFKHGEQITLPWVFRVLRNVIANEYRVSARRDRLRKKVSAVEAASVTIAPSGVEEGLDVRRSIKALKPEHREILYLAYWEDLSHDEIADVLQVSLGTVRVRLMRARRALKTKL